MDWKICYNNDMILEFYGRSISQIADVAACPCKADECRPVKIACCTDHENDSWFEEEIDWSFWRSCRRLFANWDFDTLIWHMLDCVQNDYLLPDYTREYHELEEDPCYKPDVSDAFDPDDLEDMDADLEDALDDVGGDPLDMMKALLDPEDFLREFDRKLQPFTQDAAELDPAELWKGLEYEFLCS